MLSAKEHEIQDSIRSLEIHEVHSNTKNVEGSRREYLVVVKSRLEKGSAGLGYFALDSRLERHKLRS